MHFVRNLSVSWKFVSAYFAILIVPVTLMGIYLYIQNSDSAIEQARLVMEQNLIQTKASIIQKEKIIENSSQVLLNEKFKNFLGLQYDNDIYRVEDYQFDFSPFVKNILQQNSTIYSVRFYMENAITLEMLTSYYSIRAAESPDLFHVAMKNEPQKFGWRSTHNALPHLIRENSSTPIKVFSFSQNIIPRDYQYNVGEIEIEIREDVLFDMLRDPIISKMGKVFIVDSGSRIVSDNIPALFEKNISISGINYYVKGKNISTISKVKGARSIVISIPIDEIGCSIVGVFPVSNFNSEVKRSLGKIILVLLFSSIILGVIFYLTTNALLSRVKKLVKAMKQVNDENLDVTVPVTIMDEFGELALSFNHMTQRIHELVEMVYKIRLLEREAELKAWESQINPHFLYNTLATISWVGRKDNSPEVVKISNSLAKFYRLVLSKGNSLIYVKDELDMVKAFLQIQKIRFDEMFDVEYIIDENIYANKTLKNILQPIVENSLNHGIEPKRSHGTIVIKAWRSEDNINFQVIDDGVGIKSSTLKEIISGKVESSNGSGYAIKNILERLKAYYGTRYALDIFSKPGIGTVITISICSNPDEF